MSDNVEDTGPCEHPGCGVSNLDHGDEHEYLQPAPASRVLGDVPGPLPPLVVADDVRYLDVDGNDVTDEVIANNMEVAVKDRTES